MCCGEEGGRALLRDADRARLQTYVAWNFHEPVRGRVSFSGERDIEAFLKLAHELNVMVLLRPGPYICAEWEFGGFPAWLLSDDRVRLRTFEPTYIDAVTRWWSILLSRMRRHLYHNGGPVVAVQIENEFGQYGDVANNPQDRRYMQHLVRLARQLLGTRVVLYTTDFGDLANMRRGSLAGGQVLTAGDFGPSGNQSVAMRGQRQMNAPGFSPPFCSEFYSGWYTAWGNGKAGRQRHS